MLQQLEQPATQSTKPARPAPSSRDTLATILGPFASLRLTVVLLAMAMIVIFAGTWAQIDHGIFAVQKIYFHSFFCWIDMALFLPRGQVTSPVWEPVVRFLRPLGFPMLGGYSLIVLLLLNLVAAHMLRFKLQWKRVGIIMIHAGLILLVLGEVVTSLFAVEQQMTLWAGETKQWAHDIREAEFAVIDPSPADHDDVVAFPRTQIRAGAQLSDSRVPFTIRFDRYYSNATLLDPSQLGPFQIQQMKGSADELATAGVGVT